MFLGQAQGSDLVNPHLLIGAGEKWVWHQKRMWRENEAEVRELFVSHAHSEPGLRKGDQAFPSTMKLLTWAHTCYSLLAPEPFSFHAIWVSQHDHMKTQSPPVCHSSYLQWRRTPLSPPGWLPVKSYLLGHGTSIIQSSGHEELWKISLFLFLLIFCYGKFQRYKKVDRKQKWTHVTISQLQLYCSACQLFNVIPLQPCPQTSYHFIFHS